MRSCTAIPGNWSATDHIPRNQSEIQITGKRRADSPNGICLLVSFVLTKRPSGYAGGEELKVHCGDHGVSPVVSGAHRLGGQHFLCAGRPLGGVPDPCGEGNGGVTIRFGNIAEPGLLIQLTHKSGLTVLSDPILHTYIPEILPKSS